MTALELWIAFDMMFCFVLLLCEMVSDEVCKAVECGKGTCKASENTTFFFECECQPGWKHTLSNDEDMVPLSCFCVALSIQFCGKNMSHKICW